MKRPVFFVVLVLLLTLGLQGPASAVSLNVIDDVGGHQRWPGGLFQFPDGHWGAVYERNNQPFVREATSLLGLFGPETNILDREFNTAGYDPGIVDLNDGTVVVMYCTGTKVRVRERLSVGKYGPAEVLVNSPTGTVKELTVHRALGNAWITYNYKPDSRTSNVWDIRIAKILNGPKLGSQITIAVKATGTGTEGEQRRATTSATGAPGGLLTVWSKNASGGPRDVWGSISKNSGSTWGKSFRIATFPDPDEPGGKHDLVNPFAIVTPTGKLRVYFTQHGVKAGLGYVESSNHGSSWAHRKDVRDFPRDLDWARTVIAKEGGSLVAYVNADEMTMLGDYKM